MSEGGDKDDLIFMSTSLCSCATYILTLSISHFKLNTHPHLDSSG